MRDPEFQELDLDYFDGPAKPSGSKPDLWQRMSRVMEGILYLLVLAAVTKIFWPEVEHQKELDAKLSQIEQVRNQRETRLARLQLEYDLLKTDREYIESKARDRLDLYRPGADEYVVRIQRPEKSTEEAGEAE